MRRFCILSICQSYDVWKIICILVFIREFIIFLRWLKNSPNWLWSLFFFSSSLPTMYLVRSFKQPLKVNLAVFRRTIIFFVLWKFKVLVIFPLCKRTLLYYWCISVILHWHLWVSLNISKEFIEHCFSLVCLINLLFDLLQFLFKLIIGSITILFGFHFINFMESVQFIGADVIDNTTEITFEFSELLFDTSFEYFCINTWIIKVYLLTSCLKLFCDSFIVSW